MANHHYGDEGFYTPWLNGFHMTFGNGYTISVQWKAGNYCTNHFSNDFSNSHPMFSLNAEIAVLDRQGELIEDLDKFLPEQLQFHSDGMVCGYVRPDELIEVMKNVSTYKEEK